MKYIKTCAVLLGLLSQGFSADTDNNNADAPALDTSVMNTDDTAWGSQDRSNTFYVGVGANALVNYLNSKGSTFSPSFILGYNMNKYFAIQYNQLTAVNGMFTGIGEGVINFSNSTMFTPYAAGGAGWANLSGRATGAWDVGGGLKFEISKHIQTSIDYRYIQTMAPNPSNEVVVQPNAGAGTNMIGAGLTWVFGD
jgi:OOP family OmpA-OmpF porin